MRRDEETHEMLFDLNDDGDWASAYAELLETEIGQKYLSEYFEEENRGSDAKKILRAVDVLFPTTDYHHTVSQIASALQKTILAGKIRPLERLQVAPLPVPSAPVAETPKLSGSQQAWKSFREWSEAHTSSECKARARSGDQAYADFYRLNLTREFAEQPVGDAVTPAGQPTGKQAPTAELRDFARQYLVEKSENLRPKSGLVVLAGRQMSYTYFNTLVEQASAAGLL